MRRMNVALSGLTVLLLFSATDAAPKRNVLLLISDNQNWNDCGCYGNPVIETPQILDNIGFPRELRPEQYHGSIYDVMAAKRGSLKPIGQWNEQEILCRGRRITVIVNEMVVLDADLDKTTTPKVREKHPGLGRNSGHIGFLGHGSRVEFRNIRVKEVPDPETTDER